MLNQLNRLGNEVIISSAGDDIVSRQSVSNGGSTNMSRVQGRMHLREMANDRSLGSGLPLPANSRGLAHEFRISDYFRGFLLG
jgi:hypothetical protein